VRFAPSRLYAILDTDLVSARGLEPQAVAGAWFEAGVRLLQLRAKSLALGPLLALTDTVVAIGRPYGADVIVNDRADVARLSRAAGVHVGQDDLSVADVRRIVGPDAVVGLSTHTVEQVRLGCAEAVSYLAIGPVFQTTSKARPDPVVGLEGVQAAVAIAGACGVPAVAIGGITLERAPDVLAAGAASVAVISDLLVGDPAARARAWLDALR
jgi:thiamine-phosphate pyrophosphorylase